MWDNDVVANGFAQFLCWQMGSAGGASSELHSKNTAFVKYGHTRAQNNPWAIYDLTRSAVIGRDVGASNSVFT